MTAGRGHGDKSQYQSKERLSKYSNGGQGGWLAGYIRKGKRKGYGKMAGTVERKGNPYVFIFLLVAYTLFKIVINASV